MEIPQDVIDHCAKHRMCKGCPLRPCTAPTVPVTDPRWDAWLNERVRLVRELPQ